MLAPFHCPKREPVFPILTYHCGCWIVLSATNKDSLLAHRIAHGDYIVQIQQERDRAALSAG